MQNRRFLAVAVALTAAVTIGALSLAPAVHGQAAPRHSGVAIADLEHEARLAAEQVWQEPGPGLTRVIEVLGGRGSEIGVSIRELAESDAKAGKSGVVVEEVRDASPAATAGFKAGDVVTSFDGERVRGSRHFARLVEETPAGRPVKAQVQRDGKAVDLTVTPDAPGDVMKFRHGRGGDEPLLGGPAMRMMPRMHGPEMMFEPGEFDVRVMTRPGRLGVGVQDLTPELATYFGVKQGVLVTSVNKDSAGEKAGLKAGDVITGVEGATVDDSSELRRRLWKDEAATATTIDVVRDKKPLSMKVTFDEATSRPHGEPPARKRMI